MLPWTRPDPHEDFEADARVLLAAFRADVEEGKAHGEAFETRKIWSGSWTRRGQPRGLHKRKLAEPFPYATKCAWCERPRDLSRELDVEHYRPKAGVSEWREDPPQISDTPPQEFHLGAGYWWLAFAWDNFSLACKTCNQGWKRNLFPVQTPRLPCVEGSEDREEPLLLDPASSFQTREHFRWETLTGIVEGISAKGRATIVTCGLNRTELLDRRGKVARATSALVDRFVSAWQANDEKNTEKARARLVEQTSITAEFTSMTRWIVEERLGIAWEELDLSRH